jgi:hypothetical protein
MKYRMYRDWKYQARSGLHKINREVVCEAYSIDGAEMNTSLLMRATSQGGHSTNDGG